MPTCSAPAGRRGVVVDLQPQRPELISLFSSDQWIRDSRSNDYRYFFFHSFFSRLLWFPVDPVVYHAFLHHFFVI